MDDRCRGPFASLRQWNHRRIQKRRWLRDQWASRDAASNLQSSAVIEEPHSPQAPGTASDVRHAMPLPTKRSCLARLAGAGVVIDTVVDVGVHEEGTPELISAFPRARHLLFEPLSSMNPSIASAYSGVQYELHNVACFSDDGQSYLVGTCIDGSGRVTHTHVADTPNAPGIGTVVNSQPIRRVRLDSMNLTLGAHVLLKVDVDGVDLEVLKGATELLRRTEVVVVEAPLSRLLERCDFLVAHGFQFHDIVDLCYYHSILSQVDVVFVRLDVIKRHPDLEPWANKVFTWGGYQQLTAQLDSRPMVTAENFAEELVTRDRGLIGSNDGLKKLCSAHPWPDISALDCDPMHMWSLDGGGRELVEDRLRRGSVFIVLEVGTFLGGSALRWLQAQEGFTLIALDSWSPAAADWVDTIIADPPSWVSDVEGLVPISRALKQHGIEKVALHNLRKYRDRVIPIKMPAETGYAHVRSFLEPDLIYIDANKELLDYQLAHETFPNAILCGDDWTWQDSSGAYPVRDYVNGIAELRDCTVVSCGATWLLAPRRTADRSSGVSTR